MEKDGSVTNPEIIRGVDAALDKEAIRLINILPKFTPGKNKGELVRVKYTVPIQFRINRK